MIVQATIQYFNSIDAAKILGVNVSTIKRWTLEGKLECVTSSGGHRKFLFAHFVNFLQQNQKKIAKSDFFPLSRKAHSRLVWHILKGNYDAVVQPMLKYALKFDRGMVHNILNCFSLAQHPINEIFDHVLTPVLHQVGDLWERGEISIFDEHFASQAIRDGLARMQGGLKAPDKIIGNVFCLNMSSELHDIALKMVDHILEMRGFNIFFSGQVSPSFDVHRIVTKIQPVRIYVSSTYVANKSMIQMEFDRIVESCNPHNITIFVGGRGFDVINYDPQRVQRLHTFKEVAIV